MIFTREEACLLPGKRVRLRCGAIVTVLPECTDDEFFLTYDVDEHSVGYCMANLDQGNTECASDIVEVLSDEGKVLDLSYEDGVIDNAVPDCIRGPSGVQSDLLNEAYAKLHEARERITDLQAQLADENRPLHVRIAELDRELKTEKDEHRETQQELDEAEARIYKHEEKLKHKSDIYADLARRYTEARERIAELEDKMPVILGSENDGRIEYEGEVYQDEGYIFKLLEEIADYKARIAELEAAQQWRPMSKAPTDGTEILVFDKDGDIYADKSENGWDDDYFICWVPMPTIEKPTAEDATQMFMDWAEPYLAGWRTAFSEIHINHDAEADKYSLRLKRGGFVYLRTYPPASIANALADAGVDCVEIGGE